MTGGSSFGLPEDVVSSGRGPLTQQELERLAGRMYKDTCRRLEDSHLREVVKHKITVMYGPPMARPNIMLVSFQGGGGERSPTRHTWPDRLLYLDDDYHFGRALRTQFRAAGLSETLETRTVAMSACFPEAPACEADRWMRKTGPQAEWREFSSDWVRRMLRAMRPRAVVVFGAKASEALGLEGDWRNERLRDSDGHRVYGVAEIEGCPAVYCHHLSQGYSGHWVQTCLREVGRIVASQHDRDVATASDASARESETP